MKSNRVFANIVGVGLHLRILPMSKIINNPERDGRQFVRLAVELYAAFYTAVNLFANHKGIK